MQIQISKTRQAAISLNTQIHSLSVWHGMSVIIRLGWIAIIIMVGEEVK